MTIDVSAQTTLIGDAIPAISYIGVAVLSVIILLHTYRWLRATLGDDETATVDYWDGYEPENSGTMETPTLPALRAASIPSMTK